MDEISKYLDDRGTEYIRVDGNVSSKQRYKSIEKFQTVNTCRVAVLSITSAGVAITLTAASTVFFAELYWTPASLLQAEDRAHRIGQTAEVNIYYFRAKGTIDDLLWPMLQNKVDTLGEVFEGVKFLQLDENSQDEVIFNLQNIASELADQDLLEYSQNNRPEDDETFEHLINSSQPSTNDSLSQDSLFNSNSTQSQLQSYSSTTSTTSTTSTSIPIPIPMFTTTSTVPSSLSTLNFPNTVSHSITTPFIPHHIIPKSFSKIPSVSMIPSNPVYSSQNFHALQSTPNNMIHSLDLDDSFDDVVFLGTSTQSSSSQSILPRLPTQQPLPSLPLHHHEQLQPSQQQGQNSHRLLEVISLLDDYESPPSSPLSKSPILSEVPQQVNTSVQVSGPSSTEDETFAQACDFFSDCLGPSNFT